MEPGEVLDMAERIIVSPAVGRYEPLDLGEQVEAGEVIGHVTVSGDARVPVHSPFRGRVVQVVAWQGERVAHRQRIAWLRVA
jgi:predicted deacylase